ncbi:conserved hypothetical protein [Desulfonispora thiosulfatigenes DSM 11270]|uniref:DUF2269 domain-containing protein n=1 Tax=Desulfonispora thiosulfatigenes DSM 11270 TaxID=656914 RepID=A0A1W1UQW7_DESTI|nr:hypothetical protein [Desulfonispora thiosulfatigenes]SMB83460.1 conserved hypothetical protein [Desulfonispora thiosulfatigenes DSM 11270]
MAKLGVKGTKTLKGIHLFFVCAWLGAGISLFMLGLFKGSITNGDELYAMNLATKIIDDYLIIPAAMGTLLTGIIYSIFTRWGFFKFKWITFKYIITVAQILFGSFFLGPWLNEAIKIVDLERSAALQNLTYLHNSQMNLYLGAVQMSLLVVVIFISIYKPWGKKKVEG